MSTHTHTKVDAQLKRITLEAELTRLVRLYEQETELTIQSVELRIGIPHHSDGHKRNLYVITHVIPPHLAGKETSHGY